MRVLVAPDKFKGCLSAAEVAEAVARGVRAAGGDPVLAPVADGGEGTLDSLVAALGGTVMGVIAHGPMGVPVRAHIGILEDGTAVVEMAQASGLRLVPETERDPLRATSRGAGELIKGALARRPVRIIVAIGGSATVDGGTGLARALGMRFLDDADRAVPEGGAGLARIARIDPSRLDPRIGAVPILVASDVLAPLLGPTGAARAFGPQKGATPDQVEELERGLANLAQRLIEDLDADIADRPGAGAAGGAGGMLLALGGDLRSGAELVMEASGLEAKVKEADLVITGEGRIDETTAQGKAPMAVARLAAASGVPCVGLAGDAGAIPDGFDEVRTLIEHFGDRTEAFDRAARGLQALAARVVSSRRGRGRGRGGSRERPAGR